MNDILNEYMRNNRISATEGYFGLVKRLYCNDGFNMSVQACCYNYCSPRVDPDQTDGYWNVEVGFPSEKEDLLMEFAESPDNPTETVYGYVPIDVVIQVINKHGGIKLPT